MKILAITVICRYIHTLIQREVASGIPITRIVLAGLSQGGALVLSSLDKEICGIAGIIGMFWPLGKKQSKDLDSNVMVKKAGICSL